MSIVWFNGEFVEGPLALDPSERGLLLGDGLFETLAVVKNKAIWQVLHLRRLERSAEEAGITYDGAFLASGLAEVLAKFDEDYGVLRITLMRGAGGRGLAQGGQSSQLMINVSGFDPKLMFAPCTLGLVDVTRHSKSPATRLKTLSYFDNVMAARVAKAAGFDEALMLNEHGAVACASVGNVFVIKGKRLLTPQLDQAILPGITRKVIIDCAPRLGFDFAEGKITLEDLIIADGVFITNSLRIMRPVRQFGTYTYSLRYDNIISFLKTEIGMDP